MGRHAGWLAGAAASGYRYGRMVADLVYLPETDFDMKKFLADVKRIYDEKGNCLVAVSEGIHYADGSFVSEAKTLCYRRLRPCTARRSGFHAG